MDYSSTHGGTDPFDELWSETRGKELRDLDPDYEEHIEDEEED